MIVSRTRLAGEVDGCNTKNANPTNDIHRPTSLAGNGGAPTKSETGDMTFDSATSTTAATQPTCNFI